jgi:hypothetical protein
VQLRFFCHERVVIKPCRASCDVYAHILRRGTMDVNSQFDVVVVCLGSIRVSEAIKREACAVAAHFERTSNRNMSGATPLESRISAMGSACIVQREPSRSHVRLMRTGRFRSPWVRYAT